ncbi:MAG: PTS sugar transporter subunit IIB [Candidatus Firestonebacteria bacterium]
MISLARIDDRLIHGQIVVGWVNFLKANYIIIINDEVSKNEIQKCLLKTAVPQGIKVRIYGVAEFDLKNDSCEIINNKVILLFTTPKDCLRIIEKGFKIDSINVGGMRCSYGKKEITPSMFLNEDDIENFKRLEEMGIKIEIKMVPAEKGINLLEKVCQGQGRP